MAERREGGEEGKQMAADRHQTLSATSRVHALFLLLELPKKPVLFKDGLTQDENVDRNRWFGERQLQLDSFE